MSEPTETNNYSTRSPSEEQLRKRQLNEYKEELKQKEKHERRLKRAKKVAAIGLGATVSVGVIDAGYAAAHQVGDTLKAHAEHSREDRFNHALKDELLSAYKGPVQLDGTHKTIMDKYGGTHSAIKLHMNGIKRNNETANSKGTPTYYYENMPVTDATISIEGELVDRKSPVAHWQSTQEDGDFILLMNKDTFRSEKPTTVDIKIGLGAWGPEYGGDHNLKAIYPAGTAVVKGAKGEIESVDVTPQEAGDPPVGLQEVANK